jgi:hypothetical protein
MTQDRRTWSEQDTAEVEAVIAPAAIERALAIYQQLQPRDQSVIVQARKILTQRIYGMVDLGEEDEHRLTVGGLAHLKAVEREHGIKSASGTGVCPQPDGVA